MDVDISDGFIITCETLVVVFCFWKRTCLIRLQTNGNPDPLVFNESGELNLHNSQQQKTTCEQFLWLYLRFRFLFLWCGRYVTTPNARDDVTATTTTAAAIVTVWQWCNQWWSRHAAVKRGANMTVRIVDSRTCSCCFPLLSPLFQVNESCTWFWNILYYYVTYLAADSREIERLWKQITTQDAQAPLLTDTGNACSSHRHELLLL